jgi:hypothetical protein
LVYAWATPAPMPREAPTTQTTKGWGRVREAGSIEGWIWAWEVSVKVGRPAVPQFDAILERVGVWEVVRGFFFGASRQIGCMAGVFELVVVVFF